jgi:elongation factor 2
MPGKITEKGGKVESLVLEIRKRKGALLVFVVVVGCCSLTLPFLSGLKPDIPTLDQFYDKL